MCVERRGWGSWALEKTDFAEQSDDIVVRMRGPWNVDSLLEKYLKYWWNVLPPKLSVSAPWIAITPIDIFPLKFWSLKVYWWFFVGNQCHQRIGPPTCHSSCLYQELLHTPLLDIWWKHDNKDTCHEPCCAWCLFVLCYLLCAFGLKNMVINCLKIE